MLDVRHLEVPFCYFTVFSLVFLASFVLLNFLVGFVFTNLRTGLCPRSSELHGMPHMTFKLVISADLERTAFRWFEDECTFRVWARKTSGYGFLSVA